MPLGVKLPLLPGSNPVFYRTKLGEKVKAVGRSRKSPCFFILCLPRYPEQPREEMGGLTIIIKESQNFSCFSSLCICQCHGLSAREIYEVSFFLLPIQILLGGKVSQGAP